MKEPMSIDVSVIIVNWNTCDLLRQCLQSVYAETPFIGCEVIVVDNGSTDGSIEMVQREFGQVNLLTNRDNRGFAAANNQGMAIAKGRHILLLNSDTDRSRSCNRKDRRLCRSTSGYRSDRMSCAEP